MTRSLPVPTPDSDEFWSGCARGELRMQRCAACSELNWFPRGLCVNCSSSDLVWETMRGFGTVYSYSVVHRPPNDSFPDTYVLALVDLDEGPRMMTHLVGIELDRIHIGMTVRVEFDRRTDAISLPIFTA